MSKSRNTAQGPAQPDPLPAPSQPAVEEIAGALAPPLDTNIPVVPGGEATPVALSLTDEERAVLPPLEGGHELEPEPPSPPWRTILMARQCSRVARDGGLTEILGGELVTDPGHVERLRCDVESFREIPVSSGEEIERIVAAREEELVSLRKRALELGCHVVPDGTRKLPKL